MKIFIDAGHNDRNIDTGAIGNGLREQDVTYDVAMMLGDKLSKVGVSVKYSRPKKTDVIGTTLSDSLKKRADMANAWGAALFISLHCNAFSNTNAKGTEAYAYDSNSKAYELAQDISNEISSSMGLINRGAKTANYAVLKKTTMPAVLVELAFITSPGDAKLLKTKKEDFASAIFDTICKHYGIKQNVKQETKKLESANDIIWELMNGSLKVEINEVDKAVKTLEQAKREQSSLYWILYKIVNK